MDYVNGSTPPLDNLWVCPSCGYDGFRTGETKATFECSVLYFCPVCHTALDRLDQLGEIEREMRGDAAPLTFEDLVSDV